MLLTENPTMLKKESFGTILDFCRFQIGSLSESKMNLLAELDRVERHLSKYQNLKDVLAGEMQSLDRKRSQEKMIFETVVQQRRKK